MWHKAIWKGHPMRLELTRIPHPGQSGPGSESNKGVLHIPQNANITEISPSDCLVSYPGYLSHWVPLSYGLVLHLSKKLSKFPYPGYLLGDSYSAKMQSVYSTAPANWDTGHSLVRRVLPLCRDAVSVFYSPNRLGQSREE